MKRDERLILGLGGSKHDYAACLLKNGVILAAIEEERVTGRKRGFGCDIATAKSIDYCLDAVGATAADIAEVWANDLLDPAMYERFRGFDLFIPGHHLTHAASAFYPSPFDEAAIIVADHSGGRYVDGKSGEAVAETLSYYYGSSAGIELIKRVEGGNEVPAYGIAPADLHGTRGVEAVKRPRNSLGRFYARIANACGCLSRMGDGRLHTESGKLMGLAAYGDARYYEDIRQFVSVGPGGALSVEMGGPDSGVEAFCRSILSRHSDREDEAAFADRAALARAAQMVLEEALLSCAFYAWEATRSQNLCLAGGVFLNALANHRLLKQTPFRHIFVQPASHDAGTAIGSAYLAWYRDKTDRRPPIAPPTPYLGRHYGAGEIEAALSSSEAVCRRVADPDGLTARLIASGLIVGRFSGGSEFGPRALGHRSVLADCRDPQIKERLDCQVKFREPYRPYAPAVLKEDCALYFDIGAESPYMLLIGSTRSEWQGRLPGIAHVDRTARVQTVDAEQEPGFARVLRVFRDLTGVGVLLNTSMNTSGMPIVESPEDALAFLSGTWIDCLVVEDFVVARTIPELERALAVEDASKHVLA